MNTFRFQWRHAPYALAAVGAVSLAALTVLRAVRMPLLQDVAAGRLMQNGPAAAVLVGMLLLLAVGAYITPRVRLDMTSGSLPLAAACLAAGGLLALPCGYDAIRWMLGGQLPQPARAAVGVLPSLIACGMLVCGIVGGVALVRLGLKIFAQGGTQAGMSRVSVLLPVLWAWFRLAWYELSYAATVGWSEKLYDFTMVIFQLLFLFKLARLVSGVGAAPIGSLLALAVGSAVTALSGIILRVVLFFTSNAQVYAAGALVGLPDFGIGLLALACAVALTQNYRQASRL